MLNSSFLGIFKKKNYIGIQGSLNVASNKLLELYDAIGMYGKYNNTIDVVVSDCHNFITALMASTNKLIKINQSLMLKSSGNDYSMHEYNFDLNKFKNLQDQYSAIGYRMNANLKLYAVEISNARPNLNLNTNKIDTQDINYQHHESKAEVLKFNHIIDFPDMTLPDNNGMDGNSRLLIPSIPLSLVVGEMPLTRIEVVSKIWTYVKKHDLQDKTDRRCIISDNKLFAIFGKPKVTMFEMAGLIGKHLK
ncbi:SWIB/MDM2 domain-containing protein [Limnohabitans sp. 2KL-51]|uniref:SWIB/MDM2 domain-containing protein n=1 Tax=Limnohabitans sp. 2KL-51 TaxID=1977911 RepID=UPI001E5627E5|nr:SWIB/MDM2 domain-containing protein [Limnohabitans sp. 2KL-51]